MKGRWWLILVLVLIGVGVFWWQRRSAAPQESSLSPWKTEPVRRDTLRPEIATTGTVIATKTTTLFWQVSGTVGRIAQVGLRVAKGQTLAQLDPTSWPQGLVSAQAQLVDLRSRLEQLQTVGEAQAWNRYAEALYQEDRARENLESLYDKIADGEVVSDITLQRYESAYALAKAQREYAEKVYQEWKEGRPAELASLEAQIRSLEALLRTAEITAPFTGTVTWVYTPANTVVQPGMQALRLDDLSRLYVEADLSEFDAGLVAVGQQAEFTFDGIPYTTFHGIVEEVAPVGTVDPQSGLIQFRVRLLLKDADQRVKPGMSAAVVIYGEPVEDALLVPSRAIRVVEGQPTVYVLRDGSPTPVPVRLGLSSGAYTQILDGDLKEGDLVVLNPPTASFFGE